MRFQDKVGHPASTDSLYHFYYFIQHPIHIILSNTTDRKKQENDRTSPYVKFILFLIFVTLFSRSYLFQYKTNQNSALKTGLLKSFFVERDIKKLAVLIVKACLHLLTPEETKELEERRKDSDRSPDFYLKIQGSVSEFDQKVERLERTRYPEGRKELEEKIRDKKRKRLFRLATKYAAVVAILVGCSIFYYQTNREKDAESVIAVSQAKEVMLELEDGRRVVLNQQEEKTANKEFLQQRGIQESNSVLAYQTVQDSPTAIHALRIPRGKKYQIILADGTKVWLNSSSVLKYPVAFDGNTRLVSLEGEAYFEVARDESKPFIVDTKGMDVKVLGTEFNVKAYDNEDHTETTLVSGRVEVYRENSNAVLTPGQQAVSRRDANTISVKSVNVAPYIAWKDDVFVFENMPLEEICRQLERWYDTDFLFMDMGSRQVRLNGTIKRQTPMNEVMEIIGKTKTIKYEINGKQVLLKEK